MNRGPGRAKPARSCGQHERPRSGQERAVHRRLRDNRPLLHAPLDQKQNEDGCFVQVLSKVTCRIDDAVLLLRTQVALRDFLTERAVGGSVETVPVESVDLDLESEKRKAAKIDFKDTFNTIMGIDEKTEKV